VKKLKLIFASAALFAGTAGLQVVEAGGGNGDDAFTAWAFIFNNPNDCIDNSTAGLPAEQQTPGPCDSPVDLGPSAGAVVYLTGQRVQSNGRAIFAGSISENVSHEEIFGQLTNAAGAEIHVGVQTHGRVAGTAADRDAQTTTPEGACNPDCFIVQFVVFPPGEGIGTTQPGSVTWGSDGSSVKGATATIKRVDVDGPDEMVVISIDTRL